ncbi:MAG: CotS family spore coat protein, partial [Clostridiales bacterium]|nr:CotS family spore coat protein [Clostridiales bacterium]
MFKLDKEIAARYGLILNNSIPFKDHFILHTQNGKKILKNCTLSPGRILFIHGAKEHLYANGFCNTDRYLCTNEGLPYFINDGSFYTISDYLEGRECNAENKGDALLAIRELAKMHSAAKDYKPPIESLPRDYLGLLPEIMKKKLMKLISHQKLASKSTGSFDKLFKDNVTSYISCGEKALELMKGNDLYNQAVIRAREEGEFCHCAYSHFNVLIMDESVWVVNFDKAGFDLKINDLAEFMRKRLRRTGWKIEDAAILLSEYDKVLKTREDELALLKTILLFPMKLCKLANKYYNSRRNSVSRIY